jgi:predicted outer membrane repeat protein
MAGRRGIRFIGLTVALLCVLLPAAGAHAATFDVTNANDSGQGSLRQAILDANAAEGADDIDATGVTGAIDLQSALPSLSDPVDIVGPGADQLTVRRDTGGEYPIFYIGSGHDDVTTISGLTIANGSVSGSGGGISVSTAILTVQDVVIADNHADGDGGGISVEHGEAEIISSEVSNNSAGGRGGGITSGFAALARIDKTTVSGNVAAGGGGGVYVDQAVRITDSTLSGNAATGTSADGGGLLLHDIAQVSNSTITENTATGDGGGISSRPGEVFPITSSTVARNAANRGSNLFEEEDGIALTSTILAEPLGGDNCARSREDVPPVGSRGYNLADDNSCLLNHATDQSGVDALLWPLADNGGPTETMLPALASPAIDHGLTGELTTDQRGLTRPHDLLGVPNPAGGDGADVGAIELQEGEHVPSPPRPAEPDTTAPDTKFTIRPKRKIKSDGGSVEVRFGFYGVDDVSRGADLDFQCRLDRKPLEPCVSPVDRRVTIGRHTFRVWAIDEAGNTDPTPARYRFKVKRAN